MKTIFAIAKSELELLQKLKLNLTGVVGFFLGTQSSLLLVVQGACSVPRIYARLASHSSVSCKERVPCVKI